jgi:sulfoxide reductase heme-binding subunit YedZ
MNGKTDDLTWPEIAMFSVGSVAGAVLGVLALVWLGSAIAAKAPGFWFVSRAAGIVAFLALWMSTAWGITISSKGIGGLVSGPVAVTVHNVTSWLALGFGGVHGLSLLGDQVISFTLSALAVPFASAYQPFLTGLGTLSLYVGVIVTAAFYVKKRLGYKTWRMIHGLSYLLFVGVIVHSALLGTDSGLPVMKAIFAVAGGSVLFLTLFRVLTAGVSRSSAGESRPTA